MYFPDLWDGMTILTVSGTRLEWGGGGYKVSWNGGDWKGALVRMTISVSCDCLKLVTTLPRYFVAFIFTKGDWSFRFHHSFILALGLGDLGLVRNGSIQQIAFNNGIFSSAGIFHQNHSNSHFPGRCNRREIAPNGLSAIGKADRITLLLIYLEPLYVATMVGQWWYLYRYKPI